MSRAAQRTGASAPRPVEDGDTCPVCKSSRYLNPNMRFQINPECYHKMCESCVDRIFSHGPGPCPVAGCQRTLRKAKFRSVTFEDIKIEREVDIRRKVTKVFNRREDEFDSLLAYNDYLQYVEDITFNLINNIDVEATENKLRVYAEVNRDAIAFNKGLANQESMSLGARQAAEKERARMRIEADRREREEAKRERLEAQRMVIDRLANSDGDAANIAREARVILKKSGAQRRAAMEQSHRQQPDPFSTSPNGAAGFTIKGLKKRTLPEPERAYDPFGGVSDEPKYFVLQDQYEWDFLKAYQESPNPGGYDLHEYYSRALCDAFAGLGVFVQEEIEARRAAETAGTATSGAAVSTEEGAPDVNMDDLF